MVVFIPNKVGCAVTAMHWPEGYGNVFTSLAGGPGRFLDWCPDSWLPVD